MISLLQCPVPLSTFASRTNEKQSKKKNSSSAPRLSRSLRPRRRIIGRRPCRRLNTLSSVRACACVCTKKKERKKGEKNRRGNSQSPHTAKKGEREEKWKDTEQTKRTTINVTKKRSGTTLRESLSPRRVTNRSSRSTTSSSPSSTSSVKTSSFLTHAYTLVRHRRVGGGARRLTS